MSPNKNLPPLSSIELKQMIENVKQVQILLTQIHNIAETLNDALMREIVNTTSYNDELDYQISQHNSLETTSVANLIERLKFLESYFVEPMDH